MDRFIRNRKIYQIKKAGALVLCLALVFLCCMPVMAQTKKKGKNGSDDRKDKKKQEAEADRNHTVKEKKKKQKVSTVEGSVITLRSTLNNVGGLGWINEDEENTQILSTKGREAILRVTKAGRIKVKACNADETEVFVIVIRERGSFPRKITLMEGDIRRATRLRTGKNEVFLCATDLTDNAVALCYKSRLPLELWGVNKKSTMKNLDPYISGVISDRNHFGKVLAKE